MKDPTLTCQNEQRREAVRAEYRNGLDYLEVSDDQYTLTVYFLGKAPARIRKENVSIEGGRRIRGIRVVDLRVHREEDPDLDDRMEVVVDRPGDFSTYILRVVKVERGRSTDKPMSGFDPRYARLKFSFKAGCPSDLDCKTEAICPPVERHEPEINYLAKDYASFRQLILDRLALIMPDWQERHVPDLGIALVEVLAYVGDHLSYYQDAVATEAYLETARQRVSVRRHTRLVDYQVHEGCNARAWICVATDEDQPLDLRDIYFITGYDDSLASSRVLTSENLRNVPSSHYEVFEPLVKRHTYLLRPGDLKDPAGLAHKLRHPPDHLSLLSQYLRRQCSERTRQLLQRHDSSDPPSPEALRLALTSELNRLLKDDDLYDERRFAQVALSEEISELVERRPRGEDLIRLNRLLLEEAYPDEILDSHSTQLYAAHNELVESKPQGKGIPFYTWGDQECCLPRGATAATLKDEWAPEPEDESTHPKPYEETGQQPQDQQQQSEPEEESVHPPRRRERPGRKLQLREGDVLIFEEVIGPKTGNSADADPVHRYAVRLTRVEPGEDPLFKQRVRGIDEELPTPIVEIEWAPEDGLPFPLCLSAIGPAPECALRENVSVARGNVILADHGKTLELEKLEPETVPEAETIIRCGDECHPAETMVRPDRFRPHLKNASLTFSQPLPAADGPVSGLLTQDPRKAMPQIKLIGTHAAPGGVVNTSWTARQDLLGSESQDRHFVVEMDDEGLAHLRFGDGELGWMPEAGTEFQATYRVGNGPSGNMGAETITRIVFRNPVSGVGLRPRNPLSAQGGRSPETLAEAKLFAPHAFRTDLQRAITADDYARLAERHPKVQRAAATLRWTGSWYEVLVAIDPLGDVAELQEGLTATMSAFVGAVRQTMERYLDLEEFHIDPGGEMAGRVVGILQEFWATVEHNEPPERLIALVHERLPQLREDHVIAVEAEYSRLEPWVGGLVAELEHAVSMLPINGTDVTADYRLLDEIKEYLYPYRRIGHDLMVAQARYVPLDVAMEVCVQPDFLRGHVKAVLLDLFSNRVMPDGRRGFFHPDNLSFGDGIFLSQLVAAAQAVPGVESLLVTKLERLGEGPNHEIENGLLPLGPLEVVRLDNDPNFPENGQLRLEMRGVR
jgi:predicted phage baseplate assembly protein